MGPAQIKVFSPDDCVETTLTIEDDEGHANIVLADGQDSTTVTVSINRKSDCTNCPTSVTRWLKTDFGSFNAQNTACANTQPTEVQTKRVDISLTNGNGTAEVTHRAGCITSGVNTTEKATLEVFSEDPEANSDASALSSVNVFHYNRFNFKKLMNDPTAEDPSSTIADDQMIVLISSQSSLMDINDTVAQDASKIQSFLVAQNSFLQDFYLDPETKEGFYDQDDSRSWSSGEILYQTDMSNNSFDRGPNRRLLEASQVIARLASCKDINYDPGSSMAPCDRRDYRG